MTLRPKPPSTANPRTIAIQVGGSGTGVAAPPVKSEMKPVVWDRTRDAVSPPGKETVPVKNVFPLKFNKVVSNSKDYYRLPRGRSRRLG